MIPERRSNRKTSWFGWAVVSALALAPFPVAADTGDAETGGQQDLRWGDLRGRVVWEGEVPERRSLDYLGPDLTLEDESLIVNPDNRGLANVVFYITASEDQRKPPVHPLYADSAQGEVAMDIKEHRFGPRVVTLRTSQSLVMTNHDTVGHNLNFISFANPAINVLLPPGDCKSLVFPNPEPRPVRVAGNIHAWLSGWLVVKEHPYAAVTDENGRVEMKHAPTGEWTVQAWHEHAGYLRQVVLNETRTTWQKGRFTVEVEPGENDLEDVRASEELSR